MQTNEREIIIEHALGLEDKENLEIMLDIIATEPKLQEIINTSLKKSGKFDFKEIDIQSWYSLAPGLRKSIIETVVENSSDIMRKDNDIGSKRRIIEHALENEKNLAMTLDIIFSGPELSQRIAMKFLKELEGFVRKELEESRQWDDFKLGDNPYKSHRPIIFSVSKKKWGEQYRVGIQSGYSGRGVEIGAVFSDNHSLLRDELDEKLEIKREPNSLPGGWIKRLYSSDPDNWNYENWCDTDTLVKMSTETGCVVKNVGEHLIKILKGSEPVIDKWIEENPLDG